MKEDSSMSNPVCPFWLSSLEHFQQQDRAGQQLFVLPVSL